MAEAAKRRSVRTALTVDTDPSTTVRAIFERDGGVCFYCSKATHLGGEQDGDDATRDHIKAISKGGLHHADNIVLACRSCNSHKRDADAMEFVEAICSS
jgi:5-methylcytosine-specific restriction endonuclease McrA